MYIYVYVRQKNKRNYILYIVIYNIYYNIYKNLEQKNL